MMHIAICEDKLTDGLALCDYVNDYCEKHSYSAQVSVFATGEELLQAFSPGAFDLCFIDVYLPGISGVDVARQIRRQDRDCLLVFYTVDKGFMAEGFEVFASAYLVKPVDSQQMADVMHVCRAAFERNARSVEIPFEGEALRVSVAELIYVEAKGKQMLFHMRRGSFAARMTLASVLERLGGSPFLHCHRSFVVNMGHVRAMGESSFTMSNGDEVPIRRNGRKDVRRQMAEFLALGPLGQDEP